MTDTVLRIRSTDRTAWDSPPMTVHEVTTLAAAVDVLESTPVDAIVCESPPADDIDVFDTVIALSEHYPGPPVVLWTAESDGDLAALASRHGVDEYVPQSLLESRDETLFDRLESIIQRHRETGESQVQHILESIEDAIVTIDTDSTIVYASDALADLTGYDREELLGESLLHIVPERYHQPHRAGIQRYLRTGEQGIDWSGVELAVKHRDGHEIPVSISFGEFSRGDRRYFTGVLRDITERRERERQLEKSEQRYRSLTEDVLDTSDVGIWILNDDHEVIWINKATERYFDLDREEIIGRDKRHIVHNHVADIFQDPDRFRRRMLAAYEDNTSTESFECHIIPADGREERWLEHWSQPIETGLYEGGRIEHYTDITALKRSQQRLEARERRLRQVHDALLTDGQSFEDKVAELLHVGRRVLGVDFAGYARITCDGVTLEQSVTGEAGSPAGVPALLRETVAATGAPYRTTDQSESDAADIGQFVGLPIRIEGEVVGVLTFADPDARPTAFPDWVITFLDILATWVEYEQERERQRASREQALRETREEFASIVDQIEDYAIFTLDTDGYVTSWNQGAEKIKDYSEEQIRGQHFSTFYPEEAVANGRPERLLGQARKEGRVQDEGWRVRRDGSRFWASVTITALHDEAGDLRGFIKVTRDLTERKQAETERDILHSVSHRVAESETMEEGLEAAIQTICDNTDWDYGEAWIPIDGSETELERADVAYVAGDGIAAFEDISARTTFDPGIGLPGMVWERRDSVWLPDVTDLTREEFPRRPVAVETGIHAGLGVPIVADGEMIAVLAVYADEELQADSRMIDIATAVATDLGGLMARKQAEQALRESKDRLSTLISNLPGIVYRNRNDPGWPMTFVSDGCEAITGYTASELTDEIDWSTDVIHPDDQDRVWTKTTESLAAGEEFKITYRIRTREGDVRWIRERGYPVYDEGELVATEGYMTDVTEQEQRRQELQNERERLEFVNRILRHNLLNGLNVVHARAEYLEEQVEPEKQRHLEIIRDRVMDMSDLIDTMRTFMDAIVSEVDHDLGAIPLRAELTDEIALARDAHENAEVEVHDLPDEDVYVVGDEVIGELFENVLTNAVVHNDKDVPQVEVWATETTHPIPVDDVTGELLFDDDGRIDTDTDQTSNQPAITVHVADNGPGIPDDEKKGVLEKGVSRLSEPGNGFGLYLVKELIRAYGGDIDIQDNEPGGTVFELTFIRAKAPD